MLDLSLIYPVLFDWHVALFAAMVFQGGLKNLLELNRICNLDVQNILVSIVEKFHSCINAVPSASTRRVPISGINCSFNVVVCVDHFLLDDICLCHTMGSYSWFSAAHLHTLLHCSNQSSLLKPLDIASMASIRIAR